MARSFLQSRTSQQNCRSPLALSGKKFGGGGLQTPRDASPGSSPRGDPTVPSAKLRSVTKTAMAPHLGSNLASAGFRLLPRQPPSLGPRLDLVVFKPHEAVEVGAGLRANGLRRERGAVLGVAAVEDHHGRPVLAICTTEGGEAAAGDAGPGGGAGRRRGGGEVAAGAVGSGCAGEGEGSRSRRQQRPRLAAGGCGGRILCSMFFASG